MRKSYIEPYQPHGHSVVMLNALLSELGVKNNCYLYASQIKGPKEPTLILSSTPPTLWDNLYKLIIYVKNEEGSLKKILDTLGNDINIINSWTAATTPSGDGCWTAIVEIQRPELLNLLNRNQADPNNESNIEDKLIEEAIKDRLKDKNVLSDLPEFEDSALKNVYFVKLRVLEALSKKIDMKKIYLGQVENYTMNFKTFCDINSKEKNDNIYENIIKKYFKADERHPRYCLMTPDTEERYIRLSFLPRYSNIKKIMINYNITSEKNSFQGYFSKILGFLQDHFNLYSADTFMLEKKENVEGKKSEEKIEAVFLGEAKKDNIPDIKQDLITSFKNDVKVGGSKNVIKLDEDDVVIEDLDISYLWCFLATNLKEKKEFENYFDVYKLLIEQLRGIGLAPINVDITMSVQRFVFNDVTQLLDACPILIALHLPESTNKLDENVYQDGLDQENIKIDKGINCFTPSDWVLFEESYILGKNKPAFRFRESSVRKIRYTPGQREFVFNLGNYKDIIEEGFKSISRFLSTEIFEKAVEESKKYIEKSPDIYRRKLNILGKNELR